jgi:sporulation related protein
MSMAHDSNARRSDDPYRDAPRQAAGGQGSDPLAELARLIGQDDPFADISKRRAQGAPGSAAAPQPDAGHGAPDWLARDQAGRGRADEGAYAQAAGGQDPHDQYDPRYDDPRYADPRYADPRDAGSEAYQGAYAADGSQNPEYGYEQDPYYGDGEPPQGGDYDQPPPEKRRGGLMTIAVVVALAVFGTAAAFGYRAWTAPTKPGEPPVIKAEQTPTKTVPAQPGDGQASKQTYDRPSDRGGERIVSREEQPTDVRPPSRPVTPGVIGGGSGPANVLPPLPNQGGQTGAVPAAGEPKKVKTVTIRPDQAGGAPIMTPTPAPTAPAAPPPTPQSRIAPPQGATPVQTVPVRPTTPAPAPQTASRSIAEPTESGGYVVQVSSQRSEAEAQASYRALQAQYPSVLGNRRVTIKRADLGERGIFFRANVGPFASADEAGALCSSLKEAGGKCVVSRN